MFTVNELFKYSSFSKLLAFTVGKAELQLAHVLPWKAIRDLTCHYIENSMSAALGNLIDLLFEEDTHARIYYKAFDTWGYYHATKLDSTGKNYILHTGINVRIIKCNGYWFFNVL